MSKYVIFVPGVGYYTGRVIRYAPVCTNSSEFSTEQPISAAKTYNRLADAIRDIANEDLLFSVYGGVTVHRLDEVQVTVTTFSDPVEL